MKPIIDQSWYHKIPGLPEEITAGGVVFRVEDGKVFIALVAEGGKDRYVLPKGHVDEGEDLLTAARREIMEEAGITDLRPVGKLGARERLDFRKTEWKITHYFLFATDQVHTSPTDTSYAYRTEWTDLDHCPELFWPEQTELVRTNRALIRKAAGLPRDHHA